MTGTMDEFGLWDVIVSMFWFTLLMTWVWLLVVLLGDIFRDHDLSGGKKAMWTLFIVVLPWIGALSYLFARGDAINERTRQSALAPAAGPQGGDRELGGGSVGVSQELRGLAELRDSGTLTPDEYEQAKAKVLT